MRWDSLHLDPPSHQTRVARQVFGLFVACALVPVGVFAFFAYDQVVDELEREALGRLHRESKNAGMSVIERLLLLDDGMQLALAGLPNFSLEALAEGSRGLEVVARDATGLRILDREHEQALSAQQREHLALGSSVLLTRPRPDAPAEIFLLRSHAIGNRSNIVAIRLSAEYVFAPEGRDLSDHYWVEDADGQRLFAAHRAGWDAQAPIPLVRDAPREAFHWEEDGESLLGSSWPLFLRSRFSASTWHVSHGRSRLEIHRPLEDFKTTFPLVVALSILGVTWLSLVQIRRRLVPIAKLVAATRKLASRRFEPIHIDTRDEFEELASAFNEMSDEIGRHLKVLSTVNTIGVSLSAENDVERLLELMVRGALAVTGADAGQLYLTSDAGELDQTILVRAEGVERPVAGLGRATAERSAAEGGLRQVRGTDGPDGLDPEDWRSLDEYGFRVGALISIPLKKSSAETIGVLQLLRSAAADAEPSAFGDDAWDVAHSIASQASVALTKTRLVDSFRSLFEGLIQLTVRAIDEKSAHTGEHCRKVPVLAEMLADAACSTPIGPLKDFELTPEERYELRIAAQLHDCGKVVTPVHVMDKGTKLETIFDRIELVRLRFAVVQREAELRLLADELERSGGDPDRARSAPEYAEAQQALVDGFEFLAKCNVGGEFMAQELQDRVRALGESYRWRDLDGAEHALLSEEEISNLSIGRGTLNNEEREIINYHAVATIKLLEELPFPRELQAVPFIAGSHHERMDGEGYPNRLRGEQITMQGRILGLADVFEALTAKDRPYKPGKTLSQSLEILEMMRNEGHIDPNLHDLFVAEKLYLRYAVDYLSPEQIDEAHQDDLEQLTSVV